MEAHNQAGRKQGCQSWWGLQHSFCLPRLPSLSAFKPFFPTVWSTLGKPHFRFWHRVLNSWSVKVEVEVCSIYLTQTPLSQNQDFRDTIHLTVREEKVGNPVTLLWYCITLWGYSPLSLPCFIPVLAQLTPVCMLLYLYLFVYIRTEKPYVGFSYLFADYDL